MADQVFNCPFPLGFEVDGSGGVKWQCTDPFDLDLTTQDKVRHSLMHATKAGTLYVAHYPFSASTEWGPYTESVEPGMMSGEDGDDGGEDGPIPPPNTVIVVPVSM